MPRLSADVLDSKADDWTITDDGRDFGPTTSWPAPRIRADDRTPAVPETTVLRGIPGLPDAYGFLRMKVDPVDLPREPNYAPNVAVDDAMMLFDGQSISQPSSNFPTDKRDSRMGGAGDAAMNIDTDFPARRSGGGSPYGAGALRANLSTPVQECERNIQWSPRLVRRTIRRGAGMLHSPPGAVARGNGAMISDAGFRVDGRHGTSRIPDAGLLMGGSRGVHMVGETGGAPIETGALIRDVAQGPHISLKGIPQYRTVPEPTVSLEEDWPGVDRYEAGILRRFLARTDAGALDGWRDVSGCECAGLLNGIVYDGPNHDAGSIYDNIGGTHRGVLATLKKAGGAKFTAADENALLDQIHNLMAHATDASKWDAFNIAKNFSIDLAHRVSGGTKFDAELQNHWKGLEGTMPKGSFLSNVGGAIGGAVTSVGKGAFSIAKGIATPVAALVTSPIKLTADIASGKNVFQSLKDTVKRDLQSVKDVAPYVQAAISVIPGVGAGVNAAISAGAALAQGQPITSAIVAGLKNALPGGPIAAQAFDTAYAIARGQNVGEAALQAAVNNLPGGPVAKQAAQTAIAVAKGQNLQQAALGLVKGAVLSGDIKIPGGDLATKSAFDIASGKNVKDVAIGAASSAASPYVSSTIGQAAVDIAQGKSVKDVAIGAAKDNLMQFSRDKLSPFATGPMNSVGPRMLSTLKSGTLPTQLPREAQLVASALLKNPSLRSLSFSDVAQRLNVAPHVARAGAASVLQSVQRSGGSSIPMLTNANALEQKIPFHASFDQMMSKVASRAAPPAFSHNATTQRAAQLRQHASVFRQLQARGLDAGALDPKLMPTIKQGSTGDAVVQWQKILGVTADGKFGPNTAAATKTFQQKHGLTADGIVGPNTWLAGLGAVITAPVTPGAPPIGPAAPPASSTPVLTGAMPTIRMGSKGAPVKTWQQFLGIPADGDFGPQTDAATRGFQAKNGLQVDGVVGPNTWAKAMSGTAAPPAAPPGQPPIITTPPITLPPIIPGLPPVTIPPVVVSPPPPGSPPGTPPVITVPPPIGQPGIPTGNPPGQPPAPPSLPPITTSPPGMPPVVLPPSSPPTTGSAKSAMLPVAIGLGLLVFVMSGSSKKLF